MCFCAALTHLSDALLLESAALLHKSVALKLGSDAFLLWSSAPELESETEIEYLCLIRRKN